MNVSRITRRRTPSESWDLETSTGETFSCDKLIYAAGLYSTPKPIPGLPFDDDKPYTGASIHTVDLGKAYESICADPTVKDVVVVGGCKSAVEACHLFLTAQKRIHWIVRPSEQGAPFISVDPTNTAMLAAAFTRLFGAFSPSIFATRGFWYRFLHSGSVLSLGFVGSFLVWALWALAGYKVNKDVNYAQSENGRRVRPSKQGGGFFYDAPYISSLDKTHGFFKAFHADDPELITVRRVVPERLQGREMRVRNERGEEESIKADAVIWAIGFQPGTEMFDAVEAEELGIPVPKADLPPPKTLFDTPYDKRVQTLFPKTLTRQPRLGTSISMPRHTRWSLFRQVVPVRSFAYGDRTLAFAGLVSASQTPMMCELTSLWAVAWLEDLFTSVPRPLETGDEVALAPLSPPLSSPQARNDDSASESTTSLKAPPEISRHQLIAQANAEIALIHAWMFRRTGIRGVLNPDILLECQSYFDVLCTDLGVEMQRKWLKYCERKKEKAGLWVRLKAWWWEYLEPYRAEDYKGVVDEFLDKREEHLRKIK